jgi:molecular chaperone HscB
MVTGSTDPFGTLGVERRFDLDLKALEKRHRDLSRALHPDRFAQRGTTERTVALGHATDVNEAWRILRDPIRRAEALFKLAGVPVGETNEPKPSQAFLIDMLEQREALAEAKAARDVEHVRALAQRIEAREAAAETALAEGFKAGSADVSRLGELRFYKRFLEEVSAIEEELSDGAS